MIRVDFFLNPSGVAPFIAARNRASILKWFAGLGSSEPILGKFYVKLGRVVN
ncbi:MAG TPA: hypothetical protein VN666_17205 [Nitrospira sp.]|nr:hypothetical protein [Nitrospira sp.]